MSRFLNSLLAAALIATASLAPQPTHAAANSCPPSKGTAISQAGAALNLVSVLGAVNAVESDIRKIPFIGKPLVDKFFSKLNNLPFKDSPKFGEFLEFRDGKNTWTVFNVGTYAGTPRLVVAFSHDGNLKTPNKGGTGVWKHLPGVELKNPVIFFRLPSGPGAVSVPQVPGSELKNLPGHLGTVADKAAKVTRTLRMPLGALLIAGWEIKGLLKTKMELLNLPKDEVYIMAGAGIESYPPGGTKIGKCNSDPILESWRNASRIGAGGKDGEEIRDPRKMIPEFNAYMKISIKGKWYNPMSLFDRQAYAEDAVLMFQPDGSIASWGTVRNFFKKDYVYTIDMPGILDIQRMKKLELPDVAFGLSIREFTLADAVNLKLGMMTRFTDRVDFLRKLSILAALPNSNKSKMASDMLGQPLAHLDSLRDKMYDWIKDLPLDKIKITNKQFQDYDAATETYPPANTFNVYFAASNGITGTGERGPIMVANGTFEMFGQELAEAKSVLSLKEGISVFIRKSLNLKIGRVLGTDLKLSGTDELTVELKQAHALMRKKQEWDILGIAKGDALLDFKLDNSGPKMRVRYDPTGGCAPPVPITLDTTVTIPTSFNAFKSQVLSLLRGVKFDSGGITSCAGKVYEWAKDGINYAGEGIVVGGKYAAKGANIAAGYGKEGARQTARLTGEGARHTARFASRSYNEAASAVGAGANAVADVAGNAGRAIADFGKGIGCKLGFGGCKTLPRPMTRVGSPFLCAKDSFYSQEFGRCWSYDSSMFVYSGVKTAEPLCITLVPSNKEPRLFPCASKTGQQFNISHLAPNPLRMRAKRRMGSKHKQLCLNTRGRFQKGATVVAGNCAGAPKVTLAAKGQLVAEYKGTQLCIRPDNPLTHATAFGQMADYAKTSGRALDITVGSDGRMFVIGVEGGTWEYKDGRKWTATGGTNLVRLDATANGEVWAVDKSGKVHQRTGGNWRVVPGSSGSDVGVGGSKGETIAVLERSGKSTQGFKVWISTDRGKSWQPNSGRGLRADVDGAGTVWMVQGSGQVLRFEKGKAWKKLPAVPGGAADIAAGHTGTVMVTTKKGEIYVLNGSKWQRFPGLGTDIAIGPDGSPWVAVDDGAGRGRVFAHTSATVLKGWKGLPQQDPFAAPVALGGDNLVFDTCESAPVTTAWSRTGPKDGHDHAREAGLKRSFQLARNGIGLGFSDKDAGRNKYMLAIGRLAPYKARTEYTAVFLKNNYEFALYHHLTGRCLEHGLPSNWAVLAACDFNNKRQLWFRQKSLHYPTWIIKNVGKKVGQEHCLSGRDQKEITSNLRRGDFVTMSVDPKWCHDSALYSANQGWTMHPVGDQKFAGGAHNDKPWRDAGGEYAPRHVSREGDIVTITGLIKGGTNAELWTIPKNMAPPQQLIFNTDNNGPQRVDVHPDGRVEWVAGKRSDDWLSLSGISYSVKKGKPLPLVNGWKPYGDAYGTPTVSKVGNMVTVDGLIKDGKHGHLATLPPGYRPRGQLTFNANNHAKSARIDVLTNGEIRWFAGGKDHGWLNLSGITFSVAPNAEIPLAKGWANYGSGNAPAQAARQGNMVTLSGLIRTKRWNPHLATLPKGLRPPKRMVFSVNNHAKSARVDVFPDGNIIWAGGGKDHGWISLAGITFKTNEPARKWLPHGGGYAPPLASKEGDLVTVTGLAKGGFYSDPVMILPAGMRPPERLTFNVNNHEKSAQLDVMPSGKVFWIGGGKDGDWISLSGIKFSTKMGKPLKLHNGWFNYGAGNGPARSTKSGNMVTVGGLIRTKAGQWGHMATLPAGQRPSKVLAFSLNNHGRSAHVEVLPNGQIWWKAGGRDHGWLSLAGISFSVSPGTDIPLAQGWTNYGGGNAPASVSRQGKLVTLSGMVKGKGGQLGTLPKGFRPPATMMFAASHYDYSVRIDVNPNGAISWSAGKKIHDWVSLAGITFRTND